MLNIVLLLYLCFVSFLLGEKLLNWFRISADSFIEKTLFALGLGLGALAYSIYFLGLIGVLYRAVLWIFTISIVFLLARRAYSNFIIIYAKLTEYFKNNDFRRRTSVFSKLLLFLLLLHIALNLIGALAPEIGFDALWYHLSIPEIYTADHRISFIPHINVSGYPRMMEMLFTLGLGLGGEQLAKLIHFGFGILSAVGIFIVGKRYFGPTPALIAVVIFYTMQPINMLSSTANIDLGLTFFGLIALMALVEAVKLQDTKLLILAGIFSGFAASIKYHGILIVIALGVAWVFFEKRAQSKKVIGLLLFSGAAALVFLPWPIDNFISTGNPVYPLFNKFFGIKDSWEQVVLGSHTTKSWVQNHNLTEFLFLPWKLTMGQCDGWITPLILIIMPWIVFLRRKQWVISFLLLFSFSYYVLLFLLPYWIVRFFIPLIPAVAIITAYIWQGFRNFDRILHRVLDIIIILVVFANLGFLLFKNVPLVPVSFGLELREHYLARTLGWYSVNKYIKGKTSPGGKVLVYGAQLFYYFDFDYLYELPVNKSTPDKLVEELKKKKISHILLLVDNAGPQNLWELGGFEKFQDSPYIKLIYQKDMPTPARTNTARGAKLYEIL